MSKTLTLNTEAYYAFEDETTELDDGKISYDTKPLKEQFALDIKYKTEKTNNVYEIINENSYMFYGYENYPLDIITTINNDDEENTDLIEIIINPIGFEVIDSYKENKKEEIYTENLDDGETVPVTFRLVFTREEEKYRFETPKERREAYLSKDRKFGNSDVLIRWYDGRTINLKYVENNELNMSSDIGDHSVSKDRIEDDDQNELKNKRFINKNNKIINLELMLGDCWFKGDDDKYCRHMNRNNTLKTLYNLYSNNIIHSLESDIAILDFCILSTLEVEQSYEHDNLYIAKCTFEEVDFITRLPKLYLIKDVEGEEYQERPHEVTIPGKPYFVDEEDEDNKSSVFNYFAKGSKWETELDWPETGEFNPYWPEWPETGEPDPYWPWNPPEDGD